jgi:hypothetical protein
VQHASRNLSGSAGTGKSHLIESIYQAGGRVYTSRPDSNPDILNVLLSSSMGKAMHNINGSVLHSIFLLHISQFQSNLPELSADVAKQLRSQLSDVKLLIIDEISMVGYKQFLQFNRRLGQILKKNETIGNMSIICVGDFRQMKPVKDNYVLYKGKSVALHELGSPLWENCHMLELNEILSKRL